MYKHCIVCGLKKYKSQFPKAPTKGGPSSQTCKGCSGAGTAKATPPTARVLAAILGHPGASNGLSRLASALEDLVEQNYSSNGASYRKGWRDAIQTAAGYLERMGDMYGGVPVVRWDMLMRAYARRLRGASPGEDPSVERAEQA